MRLIGDVHGKITKYLDRIGHGPSLQLGDMGLGFRGVHLPEMRPAHQFIRGNHDNPELCRRHPNYLGEWGFWEEHKMFYLGGAYSIDKHLRVPGIQWWDEEELSYSELQKAIAAYKERKPEIVVSHDCPDVASHALIAGMVIVDGDKWLPLQKIATRTGAALQEMFDAWQPKLWVFGHYHRDKEQVLSGTKFVCLNELSVLDI